MEDADFDNQCLFCDTRGKNILKSKAFKMNKNYKPKQTKTDAKAVQGIRALHKGDTFLYLK